MNELLFIIITFLSLSIVLLALRLGEHWLLGLVVIYLLIANLFASKLSIIFGMTSSLAVPLYAAIFLATDSAAEHFGKKLAYRIVWVGFLGQVCLALFGQLMIRGEAFGDSSVGDALTTVFGFIPRIVLGSFIAYIVSQNFDVYFFHFLKEKFRGKHLWLRNCLSTTVSQGIDTVLFLVIAFYGKLPNLVGFIFSVWIMKIAISIVDTPFIYATYRILGKSLSSTWEPTDRDPSES